MVDHKRIAKNTLFLYIRMLLLMAVSLYTTRVILQVLGVDNFGIYNLVGGFVALFGFISSSIVSAIQRFFNVVIGKGDNGQFIKIYSMSMNVFVILSLIVLLVCESVGIWFIYYYLEIPEGRMHAAFVVYQLSIASFIVQLFRSCDNAAIIAYERMNFYAIISIAEAFVKLGIVYLLLVINDDKLIVYAYLYFASTILINIIYKVYCNLNFPTCRYRLIWDKKLFGELLSFSGWNLVAQGANVVEHQGENFITNHYFGVQLNAARGVSSQVYNAVNLFLVNFQTAFRPQLIQTHASGEIDEHIILLKRASRYSYLLLSVIAFPIIFNISDILHIWLVDVPPYTADFCIYCIIAYLFDAISAPVSTSVVADGRIKGLMISSACAYILGLVLSFLMLKYLNIAYASSIVCLIVHIGFLVIYLHYAHKINNLDVTAFVKDVIPRIILTTIASIIGILVTDIFFNNFWIKISIDILLCCVITVATGLTTFERKLLTTKIKAVITKS